jgi:hypothetical protein
MAKEKNLLIIADLHDGHKVGFTPPRFDFKTEFNEKLYNHRRMIYKWVHKEAKKRGPYDAMIINADCIDGRGEKSGGTELLTTDRLVQCKMAAEAINSFNVPKKFMTYGTPYHTGKLEDFEDIVADLVGAEKIGGEDNLEVNGCVINYKHNIGRSSIPHGRHTAIAREHLWNIMWAERGEYPLAQIIIRSHVHYYGGAFGAGWVALTTPALQSYGSKFGTRQVQGTVDIGFVVLRIKNKEEFSWEAPILRMPYQKPLSL